MRAEARRIQMNLIDRLIGIAVAPLHSCLLVACHAPQRGSFPSSVLRFRPFSKIKGWTMKASEFINSGPPALLNNPCCCRRVVSFSFLKHAMEVHYG